MTQGFEILNSIIDQIAVIRKDGLIVFTNTAWINFSKQNFADSSKTGLGANYLGACIRSSREDSETADHAHKGILAVIRKTIPVFELEYPCHSFDEKRWFILRAHPFDGDPDLTLVSHINITKRKLAEEENSRHSHQLNAINERLNGTLLKIVHDIQSPLTSIEGLVNLTKMDEEKHAINPYFEMIEKSISNLKKYIQDTLKYFSSGILIESIDFKALLEDFLESTRYSEARKQVKVDISVRQNLEFYSDQAEIVLIFSNIISNALKYYDRQKSESYIRIKVEVTEENASIRILDNGIGITEEQLSKIFELNFQVNKGASGAGIGLFLVRNAVSSLGGTLQVFSTPEISTEFIVVLPNLKGLTK